MEQSPNETLTYTFDAAGNLLTATDSVTGTVTRTFDARNRVSSETTAQGSIAYTYDNAGRRQSLQVTGLAPVTYGYDANSRLTGIAQGTQTATLAYDPTNRRTSLALPNGINVTYAYDEANRLISQTYTGPGGPLGDLTYQYDAAGNRTGTGGTFARTLVPGAVSTSTYDGANQQLAFGPTTQTFDANGNLLTQTDASGTTTYAWDARNRLVGISGPTVSATFAYDALGRRVSKHVLSEVEGTINGTTTTFFHDGLDIVGETSGGENATYLRTLSIDEALTRTDSAGTATYLADTLGSTVALVDGSGTPVTRYSYEPFGRTETTGAPSPNAFRFTGRESDAMGLYYYRARYYGADLGRFISEDPIGVAGGMNFYAYVGNSPLRFRDPSGRISLDSALSWLGARFLKWLMQRPVVWPYASRVIEDNLPEGAELERDWEWERLKWWFAKCLENAIDQPCLPGKASEAEGGQRLSWEECLKMWDQEAARISRNYPWQSVPRRRPMPTQWLSRSP